MTCLLAIFFISFVPHLVVRKMGPSSAAFKELRQKGKLFVDAPFPKLKKKQVLMVFRDDKATLQRYMLFYLLVGWSKTMS